jgi:hypothetical protein
VDHFRGIQIDALLFKIQMDQLPDHLDLPDQIQILEAIQSPQEIFKGELKKGALLP